MHLVHVRLRSTHRKHLPGDTVARLMSLARPEEALEHVSITSIPPMLGLFFSCVSLEDAENAALRLTLRALRSDALEGYAVESCGAVLVPQFHGWATEGPAR